VTRKKLLQGVFSSVFLLFLVLLAVRFRPRVEMPAPLKSDALSRGGEGTLSAEGVTHVQEAEGKVQFELQSREVTEAGEGCRRLKDPVAIFPGRGKAWGRQGEYDPARKTLRIWEEASLSDGKDLTAESTGFRLTPEGEVVSEGPAAFSRPGSRGRADLLRYLREAGKAHLEGNVVLETGQASLAATALDVDLDGHRGTLVGPVTVSSPDGTVEAPAGKLLLDESNRLKEVVLGSPAHGKGARGTFAAREAAVEMDPRGQVRRVRLEGEVRLTQEGEPPSTLETGRLFLVPASGGGWSWEAPGALRAARADAVTEAPRGTGSFGGTGEPEALLPGPVTGRDNRGTFSGDEARLRGADWTLLGHARSEREGDTLEAREITRRGDGSLLARGEVRGRHRAAGVPETAYTADEAAAGGGGVPPPRPRRGPGGRGGRGRGGAPRPPGGGGRAGGGPAAAGAPATPNPAAAAAAAAGGYPAELHGKARVEREAVTLEAPHIHLEDAQTALALDGTGRFTDGKGQVHTVKGARLLYQGKEHRAEAQGEASAEGEGYRVEADLLTALLDDRNQPLRYEGEGKCRFSGPDREGTSDRLAYDPATGKGTAWGERTPAVVLQREPRRRAEGYVVAFAPGTLEVLPGDGVLARGRLQGVPPASPRPTAPREGGRK
jgi:lipopolysaccharide export system protein LptA